MDLKRDLMKSKLIFFISVLILAIAGGGIFVKKKREKNKIIPLITEKPLLKQVVQLVTASGNLKAKEQISVGSLVAGKVVEIKVEDNDLVKENQILAILDDGVGDSEVKRLKATLAEVRANAEYLTKYYNRQKELYKSGQISQNSFDQVTQDYKVALAKVDENLASLEKAQKTYDNLFIKSPANGIVIAKRVDLGQMVTAQLQATVLFEIAKDLHEMEAWLDVDEADVGVVKEGQEAIFTVDSFPKKHFEAKVKRIQYQAKIIDGVVTYATVLDVQNPKLKLRPGMTANVELKVAENAKALVIPGKALRLNPANVEYVAGKLRYKFEKISAEQKVDGQKSKKVVRDYIWVREGGVLKQIEVKLGINDGKYIEVLKGLTENTDVIVEVEPAPRENQLGKIFSSPVGGGIGKK